MKSSDRLSSARFRIMCVAVVAIVVPSLVLAGFGLQLSTEHRYRTEEVVRRAYQTTVDSKINRIVGSIEEQERKLLSELPNSQASAVPERLAAIRPGHPIVEEFFLLGDSRKVLYPPTREEIHPEPIELRPGPGGRGAEQLLASGYQLEFEEFNLADAAKKYRRCADGPFNAALRVEALSSLGGCLMKMKQYPEAIAAYRRLSMEFEPRDVPVPYRLLARFQIGLGYSRSGEREQAAQELLDFYGQLLARPFCTSGWDNWEFFITRTRKELEEGLNQNGLSGQYKQSLEVLQKKEAIRLKQKELRDHFDQGLAGRIQWKSRGKTRARQYFQHFYEIWNDQPYAVAYTQLNSAAGSEPLLLGYKLNLEHIKENIAGPVLRDDVMEGTLVTVLDSQERPVISSTGGAWPEGATSRAHIRDFPGYLGFWKLGILDQGNEQLRRIGRNQYLLMTTLVALSIAVMTGGVFLTLRYIHRELELSRMKSDFVSNVTHELKTPLSLIRMFAETLLLGRVKSKEKEREYYEVISRESERLTQLIENVLDFSRIESDRKQYQFEIEDVGEIVRSIVNSYREELELEGFQIALEMDEGDLVAEIDRESIVRALLNLISNAQKYSTEKKVISIIVLARPPEILIEVADLGIGMSEDERARIFEKFYRADNDTVRSVRGSGLGLAITKHTLEAHGGRIEAESRPGEGSVFTLVLPMAGGESGEPDAAVESTTEKKTAAGETIKETENRTGEDSPAMRLPRSPDPEQPLKEESHA